MYVCLTKVPPHRKCRPGRPPLLAPSLHPLLIWAENDRSVGVGVWVCSMGLGGGEE